LIRGWSITHKKKISRGRKKKKNKKAIVGGREKHSRKKKKLCGCDGWTGKNTVFKANALTQARKWGEGKRKWVNSLAPTGEKSTDTMFKRSN